jgi:hypothetical protein
MAIIFDPRKSAKNVAERGLSFELAAAFAWDTALIKEDTRKDYGEVRLQVWALMEGRLYAAVVTPRGSDLRVISLRKANGKEIKRYGKEGQ